jgi:hypothetical protein
MVLTAQLPYVLVRVGSKSHNIVICSLLGPRYKTGNGTVVTNDLEYTIYRAEITNLFLEISSKQVNLGATPCKGYNLLGI